MSHEDFDGLYLSSSGCFFIDKEGDEEGIFETKSQVGEGADPRIIHSDQDTERAPRLEVNIENLPLVLPGVYTINSEDATELWHIGITGVDHNNPLEENIPSVGNPVTEGELYDGQVWGDDGIDTRKAAKNHRCDTEFPSVSPSIFTHLTLLDYFLILFPMDHVKGTIILGMN